MRRFRHAFALLILLLAVSLLAGCAPAQSGQLAAQSYKKLPARPLYALSVVDACIVVMDANTQQVTGTLKSPKFKASTDIVLNSQRELVITHDADADHDYREIFFLDPETGELRESVTVGWAPVILAISDSDKLLVGHTLEKSSNGLFDLDILDAAKHRLLKTEETDGYVSDVVFDGETAYVGVVAVQPGKASGILVYDLAGQKQRAFYPIPQAPGAPPISPHSLALAGQGSNVLYINLFQFDEDAPCQEQGALARMDLATGAVTVITGLDDVGPMAMTESGDILVGEICEGREGRVQLIDSKTGESKRQATLGPGIFDMQPLGQGRYAISILETSSISFWDVTTWQGNTVKMPCMWTDNIAVAPAE